MSKYPFQFVDYSVDRTSKIATVVLMYEAMGFGQGFTENSYFHTLGLKLKFEPDDFAFFKELQRTGVSDAVRRRKELYAPLGGFGQVDERSIVKE